MIFYIVFCIEFTMQSQIRPQPHSYPFVSASQVPGLEACITKPEKEKELLLQGTVRLFLAS